MKLLDLFESNNPSIKIVPLKIKNGWASLRVRDMGHDRWSFQVNGKTRQLAYGEFQGYYQGGDHFGSVEDITVVADFRRGGIATAIYNYFESIGYRVVPSSDVSPDGQNFWKSRTLFEDDDKPRIIKLGIKTIPNDAPSKKFMAEFESLTDELELNPRNRVLGRCHAQLRAQRYSEVHISDIQSAAAGHGTAMMKLICELADKYSVKLTAYVQGRESFSDDDRSGRSDQWLLDWYAHWGFCQEDEHSMDIVRWPNTAQG